MKLSTKLVGDRIVPVKKLTDYLLRVDHPEGAGKAKFLIAHGFKVTEPHVLEAALHAHSELNDIAETSCGAHGTKTVVRCSIPTPNGKNPCLVVVWIREASSDIQRLVTAYPFDTGA